MKKRGVGYAAIFYGTGYGNGFPDESRVSAELLKDGRIVIYAAAADIGQGSENIIRQIASEALQIDVENIDVISNNTIELKDSGTTAATRQTYNTGNAVLNACRELKKNMDMVRNEKENFDKKTEYIYDIMIKSGIITKTEGYFKAETTMLDTMTGQGEPYWPYTFGVQKAVVDVDDETGKVDVVEITACHDVGKAINPQMLEGQLQGGCAMGIGYGIMEEIKFEKGNIKNRNFSDYIIPGSLDVPNIQTILVEEEEISGPFGAKGAGEPALLPTAPALINAIYDAVAVRIFNLPATEEKIVEALKHKNLLRSPDNDRY